jgi:hypothetical protein
VPTGSAEIRQKMRQKSHQKSDEKIQRIKIQQKQLLSQIGV